ncbi:MAG: cytochrome C oxidase subunit II, partial [Ilumatobacteraceae bacterium]
MLIERYEKIFMKISLVFLLGAMAALVYSVTSDHASLPEPAGRLDPDDVRTTEPFDEPGVFQTGDNEYQVVMIAQAWQWEPAEVTVPKGADVTFTVTSSDVVHGFY